MIATGTDIWVPQKVYQPYTEADRKRYITDCDLRQTIYFFSSAPYDWGITLEDALRFRLKDLQDKDDAMFEGCGPSVSIRIEVSSNPETNCTCPSWIQLVAWVQALDKANPNHGFQDPQRPYHESQAS